MKLKILFLVLSICSFSISSFGQENEVKIEISLQDIKISTIAKDVPVAVKITNLTNKDLERKNLKYISFYLLKWGANDFYVSLENILKVRRKIKSKVLKQNESIEFDIDLADLTWKDQILRSAKIKKKFETLSPATYYFYAVVDIKNNSSDKKKPPIDSFMSDELAVKLLSK